MIGPDIQPHQGQQFPWMQMPQVQFPQEQQHSGYGDLAGALVGRGLSKLNQPKKPVIRDSPMQNPLPMLGALAGLPMNA